MNDLSANSDLGYRPYPPRIPHSPGHAKLEVHIYSQPTYRHFDPKFAHFEKVDQGLIEPLTVHHPWHFEKGLQVFLGPILLTDRIGKKVTFFSFGSQVEIEAKTDFTSCIFRSEAPLIQIDQVDLGPFSPSNQLVIEIEMLLAKFKIQCKIEGIDYHSTLLKTPPALIYDICLQEILTKYQAHQNSDQPHISDMYEFLEQEIHRLKKHNCWPGKVQSLADIFMPNPNLLRKG